MYGYSHGYSLIGFLSIVFFCLMSLGFQSLSFWSWQQDYEVLDVMNERPSSFSFVTDVLNLFRFKHSGFNLGPKMSSTTRRIQEVYDHPT